MFFYGMPLRATTTTNIYLAFETFLVSLDQLDAVHMQRRSAHVGHLKGNLLTCTFNN